jgi:hypothetical protein
MNETQYLAIRTIPSEEKELFDNFKVVRDVLLEHKWGKKEPPQIYYRSRAFPRKAPSLIEL